MNAFATVRCCDTTYTKQDDGTFSSILGGGFFYI